MDPAGGHGVGLGMGAQRDWPKSEEKGGSYRGLHAKRVPPAAKGVYVRADKETTWDPIAQVTAELGEGKLQVYMVTQPVDTAAKRR